MFIRNGWYVAAARDEVGNAPLARTILNEPIVLFRDPDGEACALEDRCCHRGAPLSLGWTGPRGITCGYHGFVYDRSGACVEIPGAQGHIPERARVRSYPTAENGDFVWMWMGDPAKADVSEIVDYAPADPIAWPRAHDMLPVRASYVMVLENLMDLSHLSYLHRNSIGSAPEDSERAKMEVTGTPRGMKFLRLMLDATCPPRIAERFKLSGNVDRWSEFEYVTPSAIIQWSGMVPAGEYEKGVREGGHLVRALHAVTPETEFSSHYFFAVADGYRRHEREPSSVGSIRKVFEEDVHMLEQQQLRLENHGVETLLDAPSDVARVQMIRCLNQRLNAERSAVR